MTDTTRPRIGFLGLGAMGQPMARTLLRAGFAVAGYDADPARAAALASDGLVAAGSAANVAAGVGVLVVMVQNYAQASAALLGTDGAGGTGGAFAALPDTATVLVTSTIAPAQARELAAHLAPRRIALVDAPVSGGPGKAATGDLTLAISGDPAAVARCQPVLDALGPTQYRVGDDVGAALTLKTVNQLLAGVHIAAAAEALELGRRAGIPADVLMDYLGNSAGFSWMLGDRGPRMIAGEYAPPKSTVAIFVKDLGIVRDLAAAHGLPLPLTETARVQFERAAAANLAGADDSAVIEVVRRSAPDDGGAWATGPAGPAPEQTEERR